MLLVGFLPSGRTALAEMRRRPNILIIVTDDQRGEGTLGVMPKTRRWLEAGGTVFQSAFVPDPLCCPSRASIFSGRYPHNHQVRNEHQGGNLDQEATLQRSLQRTGYQTAIVGKYLLFWDLGVRPPGFDHSTITNGTSYNGDVFSIDGHTTWIGQYSTTYMADRAIDYLDHFDRSRPWFLYIAPQAPHRPFVAEPRYAAAPVPPWRPSPAVFEQDRSDKPMFVQNRQVDATKASETRRDQLRTLMSVDDLVDRVFRRLEALGEASETLAVFTSDNGYFWGEHGLGEKALPYSEPYRSRSSSAGRAISQRVCTDSRFASAVDIAPTVLDATHITATGRMDGRSLLRSSPRRTALVEYFEDPAFPYPSWASFRDRTRQYVEYYGRKGDVTFREYYDLERDPAQLDNLVAAKGRSAQIDVPASAARLRQLRRCAGTTGSAARP